MRHSSGLLTDLYELAMAAGYLQTGLRNRATFELFARHLPETRNFLVVAGIEQALDYLENVRFDDEEIAYLRRHPAFSNVSREFFDFLAKFRFHGDAWALPEGTLAFEGEPLFRVEGPIAEAQLVETYLLAAIHFQTLVASKAARVVLAAQGRPVVEFGSRRAHGIEAGVLAARAAWIAGCSGTSNTFASRAYEIPAFGTQAHSWIMAHASEDEAFESFLDVFPQASTLLVDTYDTRRAVERIIRAGRKPAGLRLDSGNVAQDSRWTRRQLRRAGWEDVQIFASGDLDEWKIAALLGAGAEVDGFGVGTALVTSADASSIGLIYKLVQVRRGNRAVPVAKFSPEKATYPGPKQIFRFHDRSGQFVRDMIVLAGERSHGGEPLLVRALRNGRRVRPSGSLEEARERCRKQLLLLPERYRRIDRKSSYPVSYSARLKRDFRRIRQATLRQAALK